MALTKFDIASSALVMIGANPIASFAASGSTEQIACYHLYQSCIDNWLSLYPWRFASRTTQLGRNAIAPPTQWRAAYTAPSGLMAVQALKTDLNGSDIPFDRFENLIFCNASETQSVWCTHTYAAPESWWPGYFVELVTHALAQKLAFPLSAKLDLQVDLGKQTDYLFRIARNADSRQQTTRKFRVAGRRSITEARLA